MISIRQCFILTSLWLLITAPCYTLALDTNVGKAKEIARDHNFVIVRPRSGQSIEDLAQNYLGARNQAWQIRELNNVTADITGKILAIPLKPGHSASVYSDGYRTIPVLCYHQFSPGITAKNQLAVSARDFEQQLDYLATNGFQVIPLSQLEKILAREQAIPPKTVVLTIDDGYRSIYTIAYPILKKYNFPATVFLYTDFVGGSAALSWKQLREMQADGLIDIQSHTKTHSSLALTPKDTNESSYQKRIRSEIELSESALQKQLKIRPRYLAYPYGDSSAYTIKSLKKNNYSLALTVERGGNPSFSNPLLLQRTMIYNNHSLDDFKKFVRSHVKKDLL